MIASPILGLARIEVRWSACRLLLPVLVLLSWFTSRALMPDPGILLWSQTSIAIGDSILCLGPGLAGVAAWAAGRTSRTRTTDLLAAMPCDLARQRVTHLAAIVVWGVFGYLVLAGLAILEAALRNAWGSLVVWPVVVGFLAVPAYSAAGYAVGYLLPRRSVPPLLAVGVLLAQVTLGWTPNPQLGNLRFLSPVAGHDVSVWYGITPAVGVPQALFLIGVAGLSLVIIAVRPGVQSRRAGLVYCLGIVAAALLCLSAVYTLVYRDPLYAGHLEPGGGALSGAGHAPTEAVVPYTPACTTPRSDPHFPVCVHPAYQPWLAADAAVIGRLARPLAGIHGAPIRAEQHTGGLSDLLGTTLLFNPVADAKGVFFIRHIVLSLVRQGGWPRCGQDSDWQPCTEAQQAIATWLLQEAGLPLTPEPGEYGLTSQALRAAHRFATLPASVQHAWLNKNYTALRAYRVPIGQLP